MHLNPLSICLGACLLFNTPGLLGAQELSGPPELPDGLAQCDWNDIHSAYQAGRHRAYETKQGFEARNPGQSWLAKFDGEGFLVMPNTGDWTWGLQFENYGFDGAMQPVHGLACVSAEGERVAYDWNSNVQEWYINDTRGLEHGFTIQHRPSQGTDKSAPLTMELSVRGSLRTEILTGGKGVRFTNREGATVVTYAGLHVYDVDGISQEAQIVVAGDKLQIQVKESGANYPLTIDPVAQQAYLKASNTTTGDTFGNSIAVSGELVAVGAVLEASNADGVDGNQLNNSAPRAGAVFVFERLGGIWSQSAYLKASNSNGEDRFGSSVALSGNLLVVGAIGESSSSTGVDGDQFDNTANFSGAAYVFERSGGTWSQQAYLKASNTGALDRFGRSVAISGELVVIGAYDEDSSSTGVNGDQANNSALESGAAYIFGRSGNTWSQQAYLKASNTDPFDNFGRTVAISGELVVVGSRFETSAATGVNGDQSDNSSTQSGAVYVFGRSGGVWGQQAYLKASNSDEFDQFGISVAISGELIVVGSLHEASNARQINGDQSNNDAFLTGAAYIFERNSGVWSQQAYLKASNSEADDWFGSAVAISGELVVVSALSESSNATGVNGNLHDNSFDFAGAAYLFRRSGGVWRQQAYLKASNTDINDYFGQSVAVSGELVVVGANGESSNATGVNGDAFDNTANSSGAAYVFNAATPFANYCGPAIPNSTGSPGSMRAAGSLVVSDNAFTLRAEGLPAGVFGYFLSSMGQGFVVMPGGYQGNLCLGGGFTIGRHNATMQMSDGAGVIENLLDLTLRPTPDLPVAVSAGDTWNFQCWYRDRNPNSTSNFTDGISVRLE